MGMNNEPIPGTYRLKCDMVAPLPDRRKRHDWRANELKAGTLFSLRDERDIYSDFTVAPQGTYSTTAIRIRLVPELIANLEPVSETPSDWLRRIDWQICALDILDGLEASGRVTRADIEKTLEEVKSGLRKLEARVGAR